MHRHAASEAPPAAPFLKWVGGKRRILHRIAPHLPRAHRLLEPFVGGGAVFAATEYERYLLADANPDLVNLYQHLHQDCEGLLGHCRELFDGRHCSKDAYIETRDRFNRLPLGLERAAHFVYLNRFGFNGLCRYNRSGALNVPFGYPVRPPRLPEDAMRAFAYKLGRAELRCADFGEVMREAGEGDLIYADPPYLPEDTRQATFVNYVGPGFGANDHRRLVVDARDAVRRGATVVISNHDSLLARELYRDAVLVEIDAMRSVAANRTARGVARELLAIYTPARCYP